jgi:LemA protein
MKKGIIALLLVVVIGGYFAITYNKLVKLDEEMSQKWSELQNSYQRRLDLIPSLVTVVKGVSDYEKTVLKEISEARASIATTQVSAENLDLITASQNKVAEEANRIIAVIESYPDLKGTQSYLDLQAQLEGTERRVKIARKDLNESVQNYNQAVRQFPSSLVASIFGFDKKDGFKAEDGADKSVQIKF